MVYKINKTSTDINETVNNKFVELIKRNIDDKRQSSVIITGNTVITVNSRGSTVELDDDALLIYRDGNLKDIVDINNVLAVITK